MTSPCLISKLHSWWCHWCERLRAPAVSGRPFELLVDGSVWRCKVEDIFIFRPRPPKTLQKNMSTNQSCEMPPWLPFSFNPCQPPFSPTLLGRCLRLLQLFALCLWSIFFLLLRFSYFLGIILAWRQDNKMHCTTVA